MWHENEIIDILKLYIEIHSVEELKEKRKACNLCGDLLYEYDMECRVFRILFREGIGEFIPLSLLTNQHDINIFVNKITKFIRQTGFDNQVVISVVNIFKKLFCKEIKHFYTAEEIFNIQREKDEEYKNISDKRICIETTDDWKQIIEQLTTDITVSHMYKGKDIPFKSLKGIKKFSCFFPISFDRYEELDMSEIEEMYCTIIDENKDIIINASHLKCLHIYIANNIYECMTPIERILPFQAKVIDLSNLVELEELEICHSSGYSIITKGKLKKLKKVIQKYELNNEFTWLKDIPFLEDYENYNGNIDDISYLPDLKYLRILKVENNRLKTIKNIRIYPKLKNLSVRGNEITNITDDGLSNLEQLDLRNNIIASYMQKENFHISKVFLTDLDYRIDTLEDEFNRLFYFVYKDVKANANLLKSKTELEKFIIFANDSFKHEAKNLNAFKDELNNNKLRNAFIQYAYDHYEFLKLDM
jgi:hypothetical protein